MKYLTLTLLLAASSATASEIVLQNGEKITLESNKRAVVVCQADGGSGGGSEDLPNSRVAGLNAAAELCGKLHYDSEKTSCLRDVGKARYFTVTAVNVCAKIHYDSDKRSCLLKIADKLIMDSEAATCGGLHYDSGKIKCLEDIERRY